ncbi:MAG: MFS transporter [Planctomycetaceae bacterium]
MSTASISQPSPSVASVWPGSGTVSPHSVQLRRNLRCMNGDGLSFSVMVGAGETYLPAFALALGKSELISGLIATVPMLAGALLQLVSPRAVRWFGSYRRWIVLCSALQGLVFLPLSIAAWVGAIPSELLFLFAAAYWAFGMATGPAWNTWVEALVPKRIRSPFFACRSRLCQFGILTGLLAAGWGLHYGRSVDLELPVFAAMFLVAGTARLVSAGFLFLQTEVSPAAVEAHVAARRSPAPVSPEVLAESRQWQNRLISYLLLIQLGVQISGPFFASYILEHLDFSYAEYVSLLAVAFLVRIAVLPAMGRLAHTYGARRLLWVGALGIWPLSGLWLVSGNFWYLIGLQMFSGCVWAAHELAMLLLFFDSIPVTERTRVLSRFNLANAGAMAGGTAIGAMALGFLGEQTETYLLLFAASSIARLVPVALLAQLPQRVVRNFPLAVRTIAVRLSSGTIDRPILADMEEPSESSPGREHTHSDPPPGNAVDDRDEN